MPHTCSNCSHWQTIANTSLRLPREILGECHGGPPCGDFKWPRTKASDYCSAHSAAVSFATARAAVDQANAEHMEALRKAAPPQETLFDESSPDKARNGGSGAAVGAQAPQDTATTPRAADSGRTQASRSGSRRK